MFLLQPAQPPKSSQAQPNLAVGNTDGLSHLFFCAACVGPHPTKSISGSGGGVTYFVRSSRAIIVSGKGRYAWLFKLSAIEPHSVIPPLAGERAKQDIKLG